MSLEQVIVFDSNADALARRVALLAELAPGSEIRGVSSRSAVLLLAEAAQPGTIALIDVFASDRPGLDRPGERLVRRLVRSPATAHVRCVGWSAAPGPDVARSLREAGADGLVSSTSDRARERDELLRTLAGEAVWPDGSAPLDDDAGWRAWFEQEYELAWSPWVEPVLVRLVSGRERTAVAAELVEQGAAQSAAHAASRMRLVAKAVAREHRNSPLAVADAASLALSLLAARRPLLERPRMALSLEQGARIVRTAPSLVRAAGVTPEEVEEVSEIATLIEAERLTSTIGAGAPAADLVKHERNWAAGRRAVDRRTGDADIDTVITGILAQLDEALGALDDARQDALYHPEARAAAALVDLRPSEIPYVAGARLVDGQVTWNGLAAVDLACAVDTDVEPLMQLITQADEVVLRRSP